MPLISHRVELARKGANDKVICRMASGWAVMGDVQFLPGYCLLLPDPVVASLNDLDANARAAYLLDMARIGDALLADRCVAHQLRDSGKLGAAVAQPYFPSLRHRAGRQAHDARMVLRLENGTALR